MSKLRIAGRFGQNYSAAVELLSSLRGKRLTYETNADEAKGFRAKRMQESKNRPGPRTPKQLRLFSDPRVPFIAPIFPIASAAAM